MNSETNYDGLFDALGDAGVAFSQLSKNGLDRPDQELAKDPNYLALHRSGMLIAKIGGASAIRGAIRSICRSSSSCPDTTTAALERFWCGMGTWRN